jgi:hypothetical protein
MGTIKFWRGRKGFGAIASEATAPWDIWCPFTVVTYATPPTPPPADSKGLGWTQIWGNPLKAGERVEVDYSREDRKTFKYVARHVRRLEGPTRAA